MWRDLGAVVQRAAPGRALSARAAGTSRCPGASGSATPSCWAACSPTSTPHRAAAGRGGPREDELAALDTLLPADLPRGPGDRAVLAALIDRLAEASPADADLVLSHGAFRTGQVVPTGTRLSLLDLDTVSGSDAARDAGNALAYLAWADVRGALPPGLAAALHEAFLARLRRRADRPATRESLAWWTAAAMAKIAGRRFRSLATTEWRARARPAGRAPHALTHLRPCPAGTAHRRARRGGTGRPAGPRPDDRGPARRSRRSRQPDPRPRRAAPRRGAGTTPGPPVRGRGARRRRPSSR